MPQANSTTSWPRDTSPSASESTLPCSLVMIAASSSFRALRSSRNANTIWVRLARLVSRHSREACSADSMIARASASVANETRPVTRPVAGLVTSPNRSLFPAYVAPARQCPICLTPFSLSMLASCHWL